MAEEKVRIEALLVRRASTRPPAPVRDSEVTRIRPLPNLRKTHSTAADFAWPVLRGTFTRPPTHRFDDPSRSRGDEPWNDASARRPGSPSRAGGAGRDRGERPATASSWVLPSVDVISAASPDFVSTASPRGHDTRHALAVSGGYKPGALGVDAAAAFSTESDYVARSAGLSLRADLFDKRMTPRFGWSTGYDAIGRGGTSFDVYSHELWSNEGSIGSAFVIGPRSVLSTAFTAAFERGDPSKPYRLIPMFARGRSLAPGASADRVNAARLPVRPYEQLPFLSKPLARERHRGGSSLIAGEPAQRCMASWLAGRLDATACVNATPSVTAP